MVGILDDKQRCLVFEVDVIVQGSGAREIIQQGYHMYAMSLFLYYSSNSLSSLTCTISLSIACQRVHAPQQHIQFLHLRSPQMPHIYTCAKLIYAHKWSYISCLFLFFFSLYLNTLKLKIIFL